MRMVRPPYSKEYCACAAVLASKNAATAKSFFTIDPPEQVQSQSDPKLRQFQLRDLHHFHDISRGSAALVQCVPGSQSKLRRRTRSISGETAGSRATDYSKTFSEKSNQFFPDAPHAAIELATRIPGWEPLCFAAVFPDQIRSGGPPAHFAFE